MKKVLVIMLSMSILLNKGIIVFANENNVITEIEEVSDENVIENIQTEENAVITYDKVELDEQSFEGEIQTNFPNYENRIEDDRQVISGGEIGEISSISDLASIPSTMSDNEENTNPNYAYILNANTEYIGNIDTEGEVRWYAFELTQKTKVSILTKNADNLDTDIFLFKLNTDSMMLESTNLSATGAGKEEYFSSVIDTGVYYFAISATSGKGTFIIDFFENVNYIDKEINDSINLAEKFGYTTYFSDDPANTANGIIDTMRDVDYYKIIVKSNPVLVQVNFTAPKNNTFVWVQDSSSPQILAYESNKYILAPGTHYFAVYDKNGEFYIGNGNYTVSIELITGNLTNDLKASSYSYLPQYSAMVQFYPDRTKYYINGTYIHLGCSFSETVGSNTDSPYFRKWSISLQDGNSLIYNLQSAINDYQSKVKKQKYGRVFMFEIGSADGSTIFGSRYVQQSNASTSYQIRHAVVAVNAFDGKVVDIVTPDPNPFD